MGVGIDGKFFNIYVDEAEREEAMKRLKKSYKQKTKDMSKSQLAKYNQWMVNKLFRLMTPGAAFGTKLKDED